MGQDAAADSPPSPASPGEPVPPPHEDGHFERTETLLADGRRLTYYRLRAGLPAPADRR